MNKPKVYVAGPLNDDAVGYIKNCHRMMAAAEVIRRRGFSVYVPCLDVLMGMLAGEYGYDDYFDNSQEWLRVSDAVFFCVGWRDSEGCQREFRTAGELNIPTFEIIGEMVGHFESLGSGV